MNISRETVARMENFIRRLHASYAEGNAGIMLHNEIEEKVALIVDELPTPVDPDLVEAREICALAQHPQFSPNDAAESYRSGKFDGDTCVKRALAAIKNARDKA